MQFNNQPAINSLNFNNMKLPENPSKITRKAYNGQKDEEGLPHGHGVMEYATSSDKKYKYEGHFEHGVRSGYGVWSESIRFIKEYEEWEWVQMGEYDSAGRLIHPNTKPGPYREVVDTWNEKFRGWWRNDDAVHDLLGKKYAEDEFDFTEDAKFLSRFHDFMAVRKLPMPIVSKLWNSTAPYARYGYGVWLWASRKDETSLKTAFQIFGESARAGIADAIYLLSRMYYLGEAYDEKAGKFVMDHKLSMELLAQAIEKGSIIAKLRRNRILYLGTAEVEADRAAAIAEAERESSAIFSESILWTERLGWLYEMEGETEKAINAYDKCIANGYYPPIFDIALIYLQDGDDEYYETLMEVGRELRVPDCYLQGFEYEPCWDELDDYDKKKVHDQLKRNLQEGINKGSGYCALVMADAFLNGKLGFDIDLDKGMAYADAAATYGFNEAYNLMIEAAETLQEPEFMSEDEILKLKYDALRYGLDKYLDDVIRNRDAYVAMGYGDEMEFVWMPIWKKKHPAPKTQINPTAMIIQPSGIVSFVEADIFMMSYREMAQLIGAEGLDAVHFSEPLNRITKACNFKGYQLAMYTDREGYAKDLPDNAVGTILYGRGAEIRGAVIIALEDNKYDTHSFHFQEDLDEVFNEISNMTGGLVRRG